MVQARGERRRVAVVYHFFAHYRAAIMQTLLASETIDYLLVSDLDEPNNEIEAWQPPKDRWRWSPCLKLGANLIQVGSRPVAGDLGAAGVVVGVQQQDTHDSSGDVDGWWQRTLAPSVGICVVSTHIDT